MPQLISCTGAESLVSVPFQSCFCSILGMFHSVPGSSYFVLVLSPEDGRQDMVATATSICQSVAQRQLSVESIDTSLVGNRSSGLSVCVCV